MPIAFEIAVIVCLVLLNGWFAMLGVGESFRRAGPGLRRSPPWGERRARAALAENPVRFLSAMQIGITLVEIFAGAYLGVNLSRHGLPGTRLGAAVAGARC